MITPLRPIYKEYTYYSFEDVLNTITEDDTTYPDILSFSAIDLTKLIAILGDYEMSTSALTSLVGTDSATLTDLLNAVYTRYREHYCFCVEDTEDEEEYNSKVRTFFDKIFLTIKYTKDRYIEILKYYSDKKTKLMNQIGLSSSGKSRFNDTPVNSADFTGDGYTTHLTLTDNEQLSDGMSPIQRLNEVQQLYQDNLFKWIKEFDKIFLEEF